MKNWLSAALLSAAFLLTGCSGAPAQGPESATFFAMDTAMDFTVYGDAALLDEAETLIGSLEEQVSVTDEHSDIYAIDHTGSGSLSGNAAELMEQALELCRRTGGALDISVYPIVRAWGFTTGGYQVPDEETIQSLLPLVDYTQIQYDAATGTVTLPEGMEIDLGSVAKGYAGQLAAQMLREHGVQSALLNLGGNVQVLGGKIDGSNWRVAIENPLNDGTYLGIVSVKDKAVITSGGYERYFEENGVRYHHIIDPSDGMPADSGLTSVSIVSSDGTLADALSTSLFIMGEEEAVAYWKSSDLDFDFILYTEDGRLVASSGLKDAFTSEKSIQIVDK